MMQTITALGQLVWVGDNRLAGISIRNFRRRLGIVYCTNRPSVVFFLNVAEGEVGEHR